MTTKKILKKLCVCGVSLLMVGSLGANVGNVSAHHVSRHVRSSRVVNVRSNRYRSIVNYLKWVNHYNSTHKRNYKSWKLNHLNRYVRGLRRSQKRRIYRLAKRVNNYRRPVRKTTRKQVRRVHKITRHHGHVATAGELEKPRYVKPANHKKSVPRVTPSRNDVHFNSNDFINHHSVNNNVKPRPVLPKFRPNNNQSSTTDPDVIEQQAKDQTLTDVNKDREGNGLPALRLNPTLGNFANLRAQELETNYSHQFDPDTFQRAGITSGNTILENIDQTNLGTDRQFGDPNVYHNRNGIDLANESNDVMMNHDQPENNGHRENILNPNINSIGIGVTQNNGTYSLAEEMSDY